jgi:hypothetical protein
VGLFDVPGPLFRWVDELLVVVASPAARLAVWGAVGGAVSMLLYKVLSPQARIALGKAELLRARRTLNRYDGKLDGAWPLMGRMLRAAFGQVGRVAWPALLASLPVVCLLAWLSTAYGYSYPEPGAAPRITTVPEGFEAHWADERLTARDAQSRPPRVLVGAPNAGIVADVALPEPVPVIHKRQWWNLLLGNPIGYLPRDAAVDLVRVELPRQEFLAAGPHWMRGWETPFFTALVVVALVLKRVAKIQ